MFDILNDKNTFSITLRVFTFINFPGKKKYLLILLV